MEKKIENYLPFYLGCQVEVKRHVKSNNERHIGRMVEVTRGSNHSNWIGVNFNDCVHVVDHNGIDVRFSNFHNYFFGYDDIKPLLRRLSSMTKHECDEYNKLAETAFDIINPLSDQIMTSAAQTKYLLQNGFDLFNLIPSALAIDATTIPNQSTPQP